MSRWSQQLCDALLADLPAEQHVAFSSEVLRNDAAQEQLINGWRDAHAELCELMSELPLGSATEQLIACCEQFGTAAVLLEMITDPRDDGWELARWTVRHLPPSPVHADLDRLLSLWDARAGHVQEAKPDRRVVVFGGHPRDESKFQDHVFAEANVTLNWNTLEKSHGAPDQRTIERSVRTADAVVVVTKLVSHNVMQMVKRSAKVLDVPFCCIEKATASQLERVIREIVEPPDPDVGSS